MSLVVLDSRANSMKRLTQCPQMTVSPTKKKKKFLSTNGIFMILSESLIDSLPSRCI